MEKSLKPKLLVLIALFLVTSIAVYWNSASVPVPKTVTLFDYLADLPGYQFGTKVTLEQSVHDFLKLDDYLFADYKGPGGKVTLYIGYYNAATKLSAAHSPLACFPGQGWTITQPATGTLTVNGNTINYSEITATLNEQKELVLYWYQAGTVTSPEVYKTKLRTISNKILRGDEQHAFVRITVPLQNTTPEQARQVAQDFMKVLQPQFLRFLHNEPLPPKQG